MINDPFLLEKKALIRVLEEKKLKYFIGIEKVKLVKNQDYLNVIDVDSRGNIDFVSLLVAHFLYSITAKHRNGSKEQSQLIELFFQDVKLNFGKLARDDVAWVSVQQKNDSRRD